MICCTEGKPRELAAYWADAEGNLVPYAQKAIAVEVSEGSEHIALGSGRGATEENYTRGEITTYRRRALAVVRGGAGIGSIRCKFME